MTVTASAIDLVMQVRAAIGQMNDRDARLFACDCAEHVLPFYERAFAGDDRARRVVNAARELAGAPVDVMQEALHAGPYRQLEAALMKAKGGALKLSYRRGRYRQMTAMAAIASTAHYCLYSDAHSAAILAMDMAGEAVRMLNKEGSDAEQIERAWQLERAAWYLTANLTPNLVSIGSRESAS